MTDYPMLVKLSSRIKMVKIRAPSFKQALNKVLALHPNKFVKTKFARRMDLISAKEEAKRLSSKSAHKQFIVLLPDGEFEVENALSIEPGADIYATYLKGVEIKDEKNKQQSTKQEEVMSTEKEVKKVAAKKEAPAKKEVKKVAAKKEAPKKAVKKIEKKAAKKKDANPKDWGKQVSISIADMRTKIKKGFQYRDPQGIIQSEKYLSGRAKQDHVREGMWEKKLD